MHLLGVRRPGALVRRELSRTSIFEGFCRILLLNVLKIAEPRTAKAKAEPGRRTQGVDASHEASPGFMPSTEIEQVAPGYHPARVFESLINSDTRLPMLKRSPGLVR